MWTTSIPITGGLSIVTTGGLSIVTTGGAVSVMGGLVTKIGGFFSTIGGVVLMTGGVVLMMMVGLKHALPFHVNPGAQTQVEPCFTIGYLQLTVSLTGATQRWSSRE